MTAFEPYGNYQCKEGSKNTWNDFYKIYLSIFSNFLMIRKRPKTCTAFRILLIIWSVFTLFVFTIALGAVRPLLWWSCWPAPCLGWPWPPSSWSVSLSSSWWCLNTRSDQGEVECRLEDGDDDDELSWCWSRGRLGLLGGLSQWLETSRSLAPVCVHDKVGLVSDGLVSAVLFSLVWTGLSVLLLNWFLSLNTFFFLGVALSFLATWLGMRSGRGWDLTKVLLPINLIGLATATMSGRENVSGADNLTWESGISFGLSTAVVAWLSWLVLVSSMVSGWDVAMIFWVGGAGAEITGVWRRSSSFTISTFWLLTWSCSPHSRCSSVKTSKASTRAPSSNLLARFSFWTWTWKGNKY